MRATGATTQRARWCALYRCFCALSGQGWDRRRRRRDRRVWRRARTKACDVGVVVVV